VAAPANTLLTAPQVADTLGVSRAAAYRLLKPEDPQAIPVVRFGRSVRVKQEDLDEWITSRRVASPVQTSERAGS
jgi:excisionase family DNA binding protein